MTTPVVNYIPQFQLDNNSPAASYWLKAYEAGATTTAVTTYTSKGDATGGTKFQLNSRGEPASGGTAFAPHYSESVDVWIFPTEAEADSNDTTNAIQVIDASVINPFAVLQDTVQRLDSAVGSTANAITANLTTAPDALADPLQVRVELAHGANTTTTPTFNLNSLGAKTIVRDNQLALQVGDTGGSGAVLDLIYSETNDTWILLNPRNNNNGYGLEWKTGLAVTNNSTDSAHDIDIATGRIMDSTDTYLVTLSSALTKAIDNPDGGTAGWTAGDGGNLLSDQDNSGNVQANTWYGIFLVSKSSDPADTDIVAATTQANALADTGVAAGSYDIARLFDAVRTDASSNIVSFLDGGDGWRVWKGAPNVTLTNSTARTAFDGYAPPFMPSRLHITGYTTASSNQGTFVTQEDMTDTAPLSVGGSLPNTLIFQSDASNDTWSSIQIELKVNGSSQLYNRETANVDGLAANAIGWKMDYSVTDLA